MPKITANAGISQKTREKTNEDLQNRIAQVFEEARRTERDLMKEIKTLIKDLKEEFGEEISKKYDDIKLSLSDISKKLDDVSINIDSFNKTLNKILEEIKDWRKNITEAIKNSKEGAIAFGRTTYNTTIYTGVSTFFGRLSSRAGKAAGLSIENQRHCEFIGSTVAGTAVVVARKAGELTPSSLALRAIGFLSLPVVQRGLEMSGYNTQDAMMYAVTTKTLLDMYSNPVEGISTAAGYLVGNYAGSAIGNASGEAVSNLVFGAPSPSVSY